MPDRVTKAQAALLQRLGAIEGATASYHSKHVGLSYMPKFFAMFNQPPCPTCGAVSGDIVEWDVVEGLAKKGLIAKKGVPDIFYITDRGRAALQSVTKP